MLPAESTTLPSRIEVYAAPFSRPALATIHSAAALVLPRTLVASTALSVEKKTRRRTPARSAAATTAAVPSTFVATASTGCSSSSGTCLYAAAWKTTSGRCLFEHVHRARQAAHVGEHGHDLDSRIAQVAGELDERRLCLLDEDKAPRAGASHAPAELRPDRPGRPRDEHRREVEVRGCVAAPDVPHGTAEQQLDLTVLGPRAIPSRPLSYERHARRSPAARLPLDGTFVSEATLLCQVGTTSAACTGWGARTMRGFPATASGLPPMRRSIRPAG